MKTSVKFRIPEHSTTTQKKAEPLLRRYRLDILVVLAMGILLYIGVSWQIFKVYPDAAKYECYAVAFWQGTPALKPFPWQQCYFLTHPSISFISTNTIVKTMQMYGFPLPLIQFVAGQSPNQALHALPHEYPLPTIILFTLGLVAPAGWYQVAFAIWMSLVAAVMYVLLLRFRSRKAAIVCALYLVVGGWGTAGGRFDLVPSALVLAAILCAIRKRWNWAFALLALATVLKFYPLVLIIPFLIAQQMESDEKWFTWRRFAPLGTFAAVCVAVMTLSLFLSVEGTLAPLSYFENRPFQIESTATSVLWLLSFLGYPLYPEFSYGSLNVVSSLAPRVSLVNTLLSCTGLFYIWWLQWRGKADLTVTCLLTLLIVMFTGKVFSPQYLIWIVPLAAYIGESNPKWLVSWSVLGLLTTTIYPYLYTAADSLMAVPSFPLFYPTVAIRNLLLLAIIVSLLFYHSRRQATYPACSLYSVKRRRLKS
jgi:glycosyl transferase family 87